MGVILVTPLLTRPLKIPYIVGVIIAGVVIGPGGLAWVDNNQGIQIFSEVGLLYLMFLAGLEIDMYHLRRNVGRGSVFGVLTLGIPLALGLLVSVYLMGMGWLTAMLLGVMYASHTLLAYPVVSRYGLQRNTAVVMTVVGTIVALTGALIVLALTIEVAHTGVMNVVGMLRLIVCSGAFVALVIWGYPRLTRWMFKRYADRTVRLTYVLVMMLVAAAAAQAIGLEGIIGAFLAGLVLNRHIPWRSPLMSSIETVGHTLFIPFFLISVGMLIHLRLLWDVDTLLMAAIMTAVAMTSKWLPAAIASHIYSLGTNERRIIWGLSSAHTAVALAVVSIGATLGLLNHSVVNATVIVVLITCTLSPLIVTPAAARIKVAQLRQGITDQPPAAEHGILVAVGNPVTTPALIEMALLMRHPSHPITAVYVRGIDNPRAKAQSLTTLDEAAKAAAAANTVIDTFERYDLNVASGLSAAAIERDASAVVMGMHQRRGLIDTNYASVIRHMLDTLPRMIVLSRTYIPPSTFKRIAVFVPPRAQYETGWHAAIASLGRLAQQVGCRLICCCTQLQRPLIAEVMNSEDLDIRLEYRHLPADDNGEIRLQLAARVLDDDLCVLIGARAMSVSHSAQMQQMPTFIQQHLSHHNVMVIYPAVSS